MRIAFRSAQSALGADGYNPSAIQYGVGMGGDEKEEEGENATKKPKIDDRNAQTKVDDYINKVSQYRAGGDGMKCMKVLLAYVGNVVDKPEEVSERALMKTRILAYKQLFIHY